MIEKLPLITNENSTTRAICFNEPSAITLMDKINELVEVWNKLDSESLKLFIAQEHEKNRDAMKAIMDDIIARDSREKAEYKAKQDTVAWFNFYCAALNKTGSLRESVELADQSLELFNIHKAQQANKGEQK